MKIGTVLIASLGFLLAPAPLRAEPGGTDPCNYDKSAMLQLEPNIFDQDDMAGWREIANRPGCKAAAADAISVYIERHREQLARQWQIPSFKWHEAQLRAMAGQISPSIRLMHQSLKPEKGPEGFDGWTDYALPWNEYVRATIAFLERDEKALRQARERLAASPMPAGFEQLDRSQVGGRPSWPQNLDVVDGLIACFGRPYEEAYGSADCRAVGGNETR